MRVFSGGPKQVAWVSFPDFTCHREAAQQKKKKMSKDLIYWNLINNMET